jgi:hypothetical protein
MEPSLVLPNVRWRRLGAVATLVLAVACGEDLTGGAGCPLLCPQQQVVVRDTLLEPITLDTSLTGFPIDGTEPFLTLATYGDSIDTRAIIRFDSLLTRFTQNAVDTPVVQVDSAYLQLRLDVKGSRFSTPVTIDLFDVDTVAVDTAQAPLVPLFREDRRLGGITLDSAAILDSIRVPLLNAPLLAKITEKQKLRIGLRATSAQPVELRVISREGGVAPFIRYDPHPDTAIKALTVAPFSSTPADQPLIANDLTDRLIVLKATQPPEDGSLRVGGIRGRRAFLAFDIPPNILDSSTVLRATLLINQRRNPKADPRDSLLVFPQLVLAAREVTDLTRAASLLAPEILVFDSLRVLATDSAAREIEMVTAIRTWTGDVGKRVHHAIVLRALFEGAATAEALFYSTDAVPALRPRLRVSYSPRTNFGIP